MLIAGLVEGMPPDANHPQVSDILKFEPIPSSIALGKIRDLYVKSGFSLSQIAEQIGLSKSAVLSRLQHLGIEKVRNTGMAPSNFRRSQSVPFGKKIVNGILVDCRKELKAGRLIVELKERKKLDWESVVKKLNAAGFRTKKGELWKAGTVKATHRKLLGKC